MPCIPLLTPKRLIFSHSAYKRVERERMDAELSWKREKARNSIDHVRFGELGGDDVALACSSDDEIYVWTMEGELLWEKLESEGDFLERFKDRLAGRTVGKKVCGEFYRFGDRDVIVSGSDSVYVWNQKGELLWEGDGDIHIVEDITVGELGGETAVVAGVERERRGGGAMVAWDQDGHPMWKIEGPEFPIKSVDIGQGTMNQLVVGGGGNELKKTAYEEGYSEKESYKNLLGGVHIVSERRHEEGSQEEAIRGCVKDCRFEDVGGTERIVLGLAQEMKEEPSGAVYLISRTGRIIWKGKEPGDWVWKVGTINIDGKKMVICSSADSNIYIWDKNGNLYDVLDQADGSLHDLKVQPVGQESLIIGASSDSSVYMWNTDGELVWRGEEPERNVFCVDSTVKRGDLYVSAGGLDESIYLWRFDVPRSSNH